jgi:hypothetical protein
MRTTGEERRARDMMMEDQLAELREAAEAHRYHSFATQLSHRGSGLG